MNLKPNNNTVLHFGMSNRDQLAILRCMPNTDPKVIAKMENDIRNEKVRAYLERRFWKYRTISIDLYKKVGGNHKFLGL